MRGFGLGLPGLVVAMLLGIGVAGSPAAGPMIDRFGGRGTLMPSLALLAAGYGAVPFVHEPWQAFASAAIAGAGNAGFWPSLSACSRRSPRESSAPPPSRSSASTANLGIGLGGLIGGLIASTLVPVSFDLLFVVDAVTFVAMMVLLPFVPAPALDPAAARHAAAATARSCATACSSGCSR